jgi:hypothetical protein
LKKYNQEQLFPEEFRNPVSYAESNMAFWLGYPTEIGRQPDEIEFVERVTVDSETDIGEVDYYLFRFRMAEPHWAAKDGWMAGVSGPQLRDMSKFLLRPPGTFSEMESFNEDSHEKIVEYYHQMALKKGIYETMKARLESSDAVFAEIVDDSLPSAEAQEEEPDDFLKYMDRIHGEMALIQMKRAARDPNELPDDAKSVLQTPISVFREELSVESAQKAHELIKKMAEYMKKELDDEEVNNTLNREIAALGEMVNRG